MGATTRREGYSLTATNFRLVYNKTLRGVVVEWLERLDYDAESRRKVVSSRLGFAMRRLQNCLCQHSSKWVPFPN